MVSGTSFSITHLTEVGYLLCATDTILKFQFFLKVWGSQCGILHKGIMRSDIFLEKMTLVFCLWTFTFLKKLNLLEYSDIFENQNNKNLFSPPFCYSPVKHNFLSTFCSERVYQERLSKFNEKIIIAWAQLQATLMVSIFSLCKTDSDSLCHSMTGIILCDSWGKANSSSINQVEPGLNLIYFDLGCSSLTPQGH